VVTIARGLFRTAVLLYGVVVLIAGRALPQEVPTHVAESGQADVWTARADLVVLLAGVGLGTALFISACGAVLRVLPLRWVEVPDHLEPDRRWEARRRMRSAVAQDVYLVGVVAMLLLTAMTIAVVRQATAPHPSTGPWGAALMVLFVAGLLGLVASRFVARHRPVA
jgi:uncharacterized membrane protein